MRSIPSLRQAIDLGDLENARLVHSADQSSHPMAPTYDNLIELWVNLEYHPPNWSCQTAESGSSETLILKPES